MELSSGGWAPCNIQASPTRWVFQEPICISVPAGVIVRGCILLQRIFFWRLFQRVCPFHDGWWFTSPHHAECSAVFDWKWHDPCALPSQFTHSHPKQLLFCSPGWKKSSKGNILPMWKRQNKKMAEALKSIKIDRFKNFWAVEKKSLYRCIASNGEYFEGDWNLNMLE